MRQQLITIAVGFLSGVLSGAFGIGGGIITTPAIRLVLGAPALVAVGTPLPVIIPGALTGSYNYYRRGVLDTRTGVACGLFGAVTAVIGAIATKYVGGTTVLLVTAALIFYVAVDVVLQVVRPPRLGLMGSEERDAFAEEPVVPEGEGSPAASAVDEATAETRRDPPAAELREPRGAAELGRPSRPRLWRVAIIGGLTGLYSGFLGLGGGFVLVPMLTRWLRFDMKRAIGTSLLAIAVLGVPGTVAHALLGHIDWGIAVALIVGVVPGAMLGARITLKSSDRATRIGFACVLIAAGVWLAASELGWLAR